MNTASGGLLESEKINKKSLRRIARKYVLENAANFIRYYIKSVILVKPLLYWNVAEILHIPFEKNSNGTFYIIFFKNR